MFGMCKVQSEHLCCCGGTTVVLADDVDAGVVVSGLDDVEVVAGALGADEEGPGVVEGVDVDIPRGVGEEVGVVFAGEGEEDASS